MSKKKIHATLPLKRTYRRAASRSLLSAFPHEELLIRICGGAIVSLVAVYLTLVGMTTLNVIARKESLDQMTNAQTSVGSLEQDYFALSQKITPDQGGNLDLAPVSHTSYVYRPGAFGVASVRNEI